MQHYSFFYEQVGDGRMAEDEKNEKKQNKTKQNRSLKFDEMQKQKSNDQNEKH